MRLSGFLVVAALLQSVGCSRPAAADGTWKTVDHQDGLTLETRAVKGSPYDRLRVTGTTSATPTQFMDALWGQAGDRSLNPEVVQRDVLEDKPDERIYWDKISAPVVSDRDYVLHMTRALDPKTGVYTQRFESVTDDRRKPTSGIVRMQLDGSCTITPLASGGSSVVYEIFTDIGGSTPAFMASGAMKKSALRYVSDVRRRAEVAH